MREYIPFAAVEQLLLTAIGLKHALQMENDPGSSVPGEGGVPVILPDGKRTGAFGTGGKGGMPTSRRHRNISIDLSSAAEMGGGGEEEVLWSFQYTIQWRVR